MFSSSWESREDSYLQKPCWRERQTDRQRQTDRDIQTETDRDRLTVNHTGVWTRTKREYFTSSQPVRLDLGERDRDRQTETDRQRSIGTKEQIF